MVLRLEVRYMIVNFSVYGNVLITLNQEYVIFVIFLKSLKVNFSTLIMLLNLTEWDFD